MGDCHFCIGDRNRGGHIWGLMLGEPVILFAWIMPLCVNYTECYYFHLSVWWHFYCATCVHSSDCAGFYSCLLLEPTNQTKIVGHHWEGHSNQWWLTPQPHPQIELCRPSVCQCVKKAKGITKLLWPPTRLVILVFFLRRPSCSKIPTKSPSKMLPNCKIHDFHSVCRISEMMQDMAIVTTEC